MEFSDIALAKFLQTVPELERYVITFQDVSEELQEEGDIKVGIFVLKSGSNIFYVPVVAKKDNIYPIDSIFFADVSQFMPITKKTITLVMNPSQIEQGKPTDIPKNVAANPSVYHMINPPRTGKMVYASTSRLVDFLSTLPEGFKDELTRKISEEKTVYDKLDGMFGLRTILSVLKAPTSKSVAARVNNPEMNIVTNPVKGQTSEQTRALIRDGYYFTGSHDGTRVAFSVQDFLKNGTYTTISNLDGNKDYNVVFANGDERQAFIPKLSKENVRSTHAVAIFTDGSFAYCSNSLVVAGDALPRREVLTTLFNVAPPCMLKDAYVGDIIMVALNNGEFLGPIEVRRSVIANENTVLSGKFLTSHQDVTIHGSRNLASSIIAENCHEIHIPSATMVFKLGENRCQDLALTPNSAQRRQELTQLQYMGSEVNIGFDGIEYSVNGRAVGTEPELMKILVIKEGIDPDKAKSFVKQANETKFTKIFLTKRAYSTDASPTEVPSYGATAPDQPKVGLNGSFVPNVSAALNVNDSQIAEASIISELLQEQDMFSAVSEYLPELEQAVDKLGRTLLLARINISKLAETHDADSVYSFLANLRNVYKTLGDNVIKIKEMTAVSKGA